MSSRWKLIVAFCLCFASSIRCDLSAQELKLILRSRPNAAGDTNSIALLEREESWKPDETAIIVCDVWDLHHSLNAVRRVEEFAPRLDAVLKEARKRGVTIVHSPSDCMDAYAEHPARLRAMNVPVSTRLPYDIRSWCSVIPAEERAVYPIDQSDGGDDDDPTEHAEWAAKLEKMGRNPGTPWKSQSDLITIDSERDFISDRGDEVWNVLESRGIRNVILTGVHVNMCVLGRPFGLRQMARNGKNVVLMRDMTDTMYNPKSWPYVSHFEGTSRIVAHIERFVCPTITSDQIIGGKPFRFKGDDTASGKTGATTGADSPPTLEDFQRRWVTVDVPFTGKNSTQRNLKGYAGPGWYRCVVKIPGAWVEGRQLVLSFEPPIDGDHLQAWVNGQALKPSSDATLSLPSTAITPDDHNLIVIRVENQSNQLQKPPVLKVMQTDHELTLAGRWQFRIGDDPAWSNMVLPSKFGGSADIVFAPEDPLFVSRPLTRPFEFTAGIEGPACDRDGNVYAVNYERQGTIGRVTPEGIGEVFVELPEGSVGNGIRFNREGIMFVADYPRHNILRIDPQTRQITTLAHHDEMNQPNDIAIASDGTLYASDPNWTKSTGQLWRIDTDGTTTRLAAEMGTTNGIDVSPDGKTLYVNESAQRNIWAFTISDDRTLSGKRLLKKFEDHGFDGMRCDVDGNLYVTRYGKGTVVKLSPEGEILQEIDVLGMRPSNLCFGGPDGCTVYVTEVEFQRLVQFRVDRPGLAWQQWNESK